MPVLDNSHIAAVPLKKAYRLLNHGPSILVSARHGGVENVMAAAWACALDFAPPKLTVVLDKATRTRAPAAARPCRTGRCRGRSRPASPSR